VIYNVNPLMRLDGYYMLMDYLEIPDLSAKGEKLLREFIARWIFGIDPEPDPLMPQTGRGWFALFAFASKIYRFIVVYGILIFLYTVLKPYGLQVVGQAMAMAMVFSMGIGFIVSGYRIATTRRHEPINRLRASLGLTLVLGFVIWAGTFPLPLVRWAPFVVEPRDVAHVVTKVPGELIEVHVQPGDHVVPGQLLAKLRDPRLDDRRRALIVKRSLQKKAIELAKAADDPGSRVLAEEALRTVELQLSELDQQLANLTITAPIAGRVIESPRQPPPTLDQSKTRLAGWSGTPLDKKNIGSFLETRTHLLSISPNDEMQAILYLDQSDRHDIDVGSRIGLKFDHLPTSVVRGTVTHIATGHSDFAPEHLSVKNGGLMPTVTNREGREQIDDAAYQVIVLFEDHSEPLLTNLRGTARFYPQRSALSWLWRSLQTTFRFRM
jgi:putative peptide zinc metalloprotease protein